MNRTEIIDVFVVRAAPADRPELRRELARMSKEELEEAYEILQTRAKIQAKEEQILQIQAERAAERALNQHYIR
jgi:hypothetical protein